jgi:SAM-dependent methyltransferase
MSAGTAARLTRRLLRVVVPPRYRQSLRQLFNASTWPIYAGRRYRCPCCRSGFARFRVYVADSGYRETMCPRCGSLGRQRVDWLFLRDRGLLDHRPLCLLHIAPEPCFRRRLAAMPGLTYISGDIDSARAADRLDVTQIQHADATFDGVVCNHVLEHVPLDRLAMSELHRVLKPEGWAMLQAPIAWGRAETFEDPGVTDPRERERVFGQYDHVRIYGRDYVSRLERVGFEVEVADYVSTVDRDVAERFQLDSQERVVLCRKPSSGAVSSSD